MTMISPTLEACQHKISHPRKVRKTLVSNAYNYYWSKQHMEKVTTVLQVSKTQEQLQFANIGTSGADNKLFLDPLLIAMNKDEFSKAAQRLLTDYFQTVFKLVKEGKAKEQTLLSILRNSKENNSFRLGKSEFIKDIYPNGRGCGPDMLFKLLTRVEHRRLIEDGTIKDPMDIILFVKNFNEDRLSDLLASILFELLSEFTVRQALMHNPDATFEKQTGLRWDLTTHNWVEFHYNQLLDLNRVSLSLVPKNIVTDRYRYNADNYLMAHLMQYEQEEELRVERETKPDAVKRNKKLIRSEKKEELGNISNKDLIIQLTLAHRSKNPVNNYKKDMAIKYNGGLSDSQITSIIEKPYAEIQKGLA